MDVGAVIDGTYRIEVNTPLGRKAGTVTLRVEGSMVIANINAPLIGKQQIEAPLEGDVFTTEGKLRLGLLGKISYSMRGEVVGDDLRISIDSSKGVFGLVGKRTGA